MSLSALQDDMMAALLDDSRALPPHWSAREAAGLAIYRNNYRSALLAAMAESYPRTMAWVGEDAFAKAAAHHIITHPPSSWTLDDAGAGFADTLTDLFAHDGDVAELAAVEWAMQSAFTAADAPVLSSALFAEKTAGFAEDDWEAMRLTLHPCVHVVPVAYDIAAIWARTADGAVEDASIAPMPAPMACIVHRAETGQAAFVLRPHWEGAILCDMAGGQDFGSICAAIAEAVGEEAAATQAGAMLSHWLGQGWLRAN